MVDASTDLAGEMCLTHAEAVETWVHALCASVMRAYVGVGLLLGPGGLLCAFTSTTFSVKGTVSVVWTPRIDAERNAFASWVATGVFVAVI